MNYILGLIGPSGSGKTAIMLGLLKARPNNVRILQSTTTRPRRDNSDDRFYHFVTQEQFKAKSSGGEFINEENYAGNFYGSEKAHYTDILSKAHGIMAVVEPAIGKLAAFHPIKIIRIKPFNQKVFRGVERQTADLERGKIPVTVDLEIKNSFERGGLKRAVGELIDFVDSL